jgi:hypothetical protein
MTPTSRTEVTDRMLIFGQRHLETILARYEAHYNGRRRHRSNHPGPTTPSLISPASGSSVGPSSTASSTSMGGRYEAKLSTSGRVLEPRRPYSGTP